MDLNLNEKFIVDIILPNYNKKKFLEETIQSVINQSFKNWNLIIIDNNSTDGSIEILKKFIKINRVNIILLKRNMGLSFSRNLGLRFSKNKYVAFIDSDDVWHIDKLQEQVRFTEQNNYFFTYTNYTPFYCTNKKKYFKETITAKREYDLNSFILDTSIATSSMLISRKLIGHLKFLKNSHNEDYDFKCKILQKNIRAFNLLKNYTFYRITKNSRSSYKIKSLISIFNTNKKLLKLSLYKNLKSIFDISLKSLIKYGLK